MPLSPDQPYKFAKGDALDAVAKKYGHRDGKPIWNAPENKGIAPLAFARGAEAHMALS